tara:strand:- start:4572 stop:5648 length:1077 start_codon:yes stop_codon:yes gene_type:complete
MSKYPKLFIPGPTHVPEHIMNTLSTPQIGHRTEEISELIKSIIIDIKEVLYTTNNIYLISHAATGLWEMSLKNSVRRGVLHCVNGAFSSKWVKVSDSCGYNYGVIEYEWGKGVKVDDIDRMLSNGNYDVLAMVHNETSTGVMSNLEDIADLLKSKYPDVLWIVDAVSSMAGIKIELDKLGIDFILSSTQKAWGLPAGFSICAVSDRMLDISKTINNKGYFFDLEVYEKYFSKFQTPSTPSIPHLFGLREVLDIIKKEGIDNRWKRHKGMRDYVIKWANSKGQNLFSEEGCHSHTITCIENTQNWDIDKIYNTLLEKGYRMDRGYGNLRGKAFRIPHMGNIYMEDLKDYINQIEGIINV